MTARSAIQETFRKIQEEHNERSPLALISDCRTRWSSTYQMIDRFITLKDHILELLEYAHSPDLVRRTWDALVAVTLFDDEWRLLEYAREMLKLLDDATNSTAKDSFVSLPATYAVFEKLIHECKELIREFDQNIEENVDKVWFTQLRGATDKCHDKLLEYYDKLAEKEAMIIPLLLHPDYSMNYVEYIWRLHPDYIVSAKYAFVNAVNALFAAEGVASFHLPYSHIERA